MAVKKENATSRVKITEKKPCVKKEKEETFQIVPKTKILFVASESTPYMVTGGLAEVIGSLSVSLAKRNRYDVRVVMPLYSEMKSEFREKLTFLGSITVPLSWRNQYCGIFSCKKDGVTFYFIDNEYYFKRKGCYGHFDDGERFAFFSKSVLEMMPFIGFYPDLLHCHDWQAALATIYLKTTYACRNEYARIKTLFTIHNIEYQGNFPLAVLGDVFDLSERERSLVEWNGCVNLMKGAIVCSDRFSTVSPTYAKQILTAEYAHGLQAVISEHQGKLCGILNGIDVKSYDSKTDKSLFKTFKKGEYEGKSVCKKQLQAMLSLPQKDVPVFAMITRLVSHKGLDLVLTVIEDALREDVQFVLLGTGDSRYEEYFKALAAKYPDKVSANILFNGDLSRKIYAGADIFLMLSKSEPCGLSQMIACRYATVPLVRETGGLYDSIKPCGAGGNGFTFASYNAYDMLYVMHEAIDLYHDKEKWNELRLKAHGSDFSWLRSAKEYEKLYDEILRG